MGPFDELLVKSLIMQTLHGLNYLHKMHIIHRDIKGGNSKHWQKFNLIQF
jgi:serine/threonine protein kinase